MKVLVVLPFAPWPVRVRSINLWPRVARDAEVHVVALTTDLPAGVRPAPLPDVASVEYVAFSTKRAALRAGLALSGGKPLRNAYNDDAAARGAVAAAYARIRPDVVYAERLRALPLIADLPPERVVLDPTDSLPLFCAEVLRAGAAAPIKQSLLARIERARLARCERDAYPRFAAVVACSTRDAGAMRESAPGAAVRVVANGVDLYRFSPSPPPEQGGSAVMTGNFGYWPNTEAAGWLARRAPAVRERTGGPVVFAGANPPSWLERAHRRGELVTTGFVPDLAHQYRRAAVAVAPVRFAVGTQNKVLEAMASARPVVVTPQCVAGLEPEGRAVVVSAERARFVDAIASVVRQPRLRRDLGERGRAYVERHHDWDRLAPELLDVLAKAA